MAGVKLPGSEIQNRVDKCFELRYKSEGSLKFREWIAYCHENYGDKSEKQYTAYWTKASEMYSEDWREKLNRTLDPAVNELISLLASEDEKIRQRAIDQIMKYTGNDVDKVENKIEGNITIDVNFGDES